MAKDTRPTKHDFGTAIVFVRHGHRDKPDPHADNGLSDKGFRQVEDLVKDYSAGHLPPAKHFWTSPKLRCTETLSPLSILGGATMKIEKLLDEQNIAEDRHEFQQRIEELIAKATALGETVYLCSHGDLIPDAIDLLTGKHVDASKGEAIILKQKKNNKWDIT